MGLSHIPSPNGLNNTLLSPNCVLENGFHCGNGGQSIHSMDRGGVRSLRLPRSSPGSTSGHVVSMTSSNRTKCRQDAASESIVVFVWKEEVGLWF